MDLFYFPDTIAEGADHTSALSDSACPYAGWSAPAGKPGTIVILGYSDRSVYPPRVTEYGIIGFGKDVTAPLRNRTVPDAEN